MVRVFGFGVAFTMLAGASPGHAALSLNLFDSGFSQPLFATGRVNDLYVVQQGGAIIKVNRSNKSRSTFFTVPDIATGGEKGLLGFAFDPSYNRNGRFYVNVTTQVSGQLVSQVRRYTNPAVATEAPLVILQINKPFDNHNGGWIGFGSDKTLYVATGDGGSANDPFNNAQNQASLLGKILRIDVRKDAYPADPLRNYTIPASNPFGSEVYAYGLRNPFRSSFDAVTGDLWIGDVGQGRFEEVNRIAAGTSGQNFGWRPLEGTLPTPGVGDAIPPGTTAPVAGYTHASGDKSITGGYVFRGGSATELAGKYVFGDFVSGRLFSVGLDGTGFGELAGLTTGLGQVNWSSFGQDVNLNLYAVDYNGRVFGFRGTKSPTSLAADEQAGIQAAVPEPGSWTMLITGFGLTGVMVRRRRATGGTTGRHQSAALAHSSARAVRP